LQAADVVFPAIPAPGLDVSLVLWMAIFGFPIAVVLAWSFELTPDEVRRTVAASPGEIDAIVDAPALTRWPSGLLALGGLSCSASAFGVGLGPQLIHRKRISRFLWNRRVEPT
jgi:hypothetical protein